MMKPLNVLNQAVGKNVMIELKGRGEYRGVPDGYGPHMNVVLRNAEEYCEGQPSRRLSVVIVHEDNVVYISLRGVTNHGKGNTGTGKAQQVQDAHPLPQVRQTFVPRQEGRLRFLWIRQDRDHQVLQLG